MEQKVVITNNDKIINDWIDRGWKVISVTSGHIATTGAYSASYHSNFCFVLERKA